MYNNLEPSFIDGFSDLCVKLVTHFSTIIPIKKSSMKLFGVTQYEDESTPVYLKRCNKEMLKEKKLFELVALEVLI